MNTTTHRWTRIVAAAMAVSLLAGCATMSDEDKTKGQAMGVLGSLGAVVGGVIGHQMGHKAAGAVVGGVVGVAGGALYGEHVANKKQDYASQEDYLDACAAQAQEVIGLATDYNQTLVTQVAELDAEVTATMAAYGKKEAQKEDVLALQETLAAQHKDAAESLAAITEEIKLQRGVLESEAGDAAPEQLKKLEEQIAQLEEQKAELTEHTDRLASIQSRISV